MRFFKEPQLYMSRGEYKKEYRKAVKNILIRHGIIEPDRCREPKDYSDHGKYGYGANAQHLAMRDLD